MANKKPRNPLKFLDNMSEITKRKLADIEEGTDKRSKQQLFNDLSAVLKRRLEIEDVSDAMNYIAGQHGLQATVSDGKVSAVGPSELVKQQQDVPFSGEFVPDVVPAAMAENARFWAGVYDAFPGVDFSDNTKEGLDTAQEVVRERSPVQSVVGGVIPYIAPGGATTAVAARALPGLAGYLSGAVIGAGEGALRLPEQDSSRLEGAVVGALAGGVGQALQRGASTFGGSRLREAYEGSGLQKGLGKAYDKTGIQQVYDKAKIPERMGEVYEKLGIQHLPSVRKPFTPFKTYSLDRAGPRPKRLPADFKKADVQDTEISLLEGILEGRHGNVARRDVKGAATKLKKDLDSIIYDSSSHGPNIPEGYDKEVHKSVLDALTRRREAEKRLTARIGQSASLLGDAATFVSTYTPGTGPKRYAKLYMRSLADPDNSGINRRIQQEILRDAGLIPRNVAATEGVIQAPLRAGFRYAAERSRDRDR